jgi:hypothetical protein
LELRVSDDNGMTWGAPQFPFGAEVFDPAGFAPRLVASHDGQTLYVFSGVGSIVYRATTDPTLAVWSVAVPAGDSTMRAASNNNCGASQPECYRAHAYSFMETATPGRWIYVAKSDAGFGQSGRGTQVGSLGGSWSLQVDHGGSGGITGCCGHSTATTMLDRDGAVYFLRSYSGGQNIYYRKSTDGGSTWGPYVNAYSPDLDFLTTSAPVGLFVPGYTRDGYVWYAGFGGAEDTARVIPLWVEPKPYSDTSTVRLFGSAGGDQPDAGSPPAIELPDDLSADGLQFTVDGRVVDADAVDSFTATADYGDGSGPQQVIVASDRTFRLSHHYGSIGAFDLTVSVLDSRGLSGAAIRTVTVHPRRLVLYVHGTTGSFLNDDFLSVLAPLASRYTLQRFQYYEDFGMRTVGANDLTCRGGGQRPLPVIDRSAFTFTIDEPDPAPGVCDSDDDLELNAVLLDADVANFSHTFDRVTIVSNSGGGAIVRAYLAYANAAHTGTLDVVDGVVFMEGVQAGSYLAKAWQEAGFKTARSPQGGFWDSAFDVLKVYAIHDPRRPVFQDVLPGGAFQSYVARDAAFPDNVNYVNVAGDITVHYYTQLLWWQWDTGQQQLGDLVMLPGNDDPTAPSADGGARLLPSSIGRGSSSTQWILHREIPVINGDGDQAALEAALLDPAAHLNFRPEQMCVQMPRPEGGVQVMRLNDAIIAAVVALDSGGPDGVALGIGNWNRTVCP